MKEKKFIQFKAAFLLFLFSLNILVGTACALGMDMGFNSHHHAEEEETKSSVHIHKNGKEHHHNKAEEQHKTDDKKDACCNDEVSKLLQTDKAIPQFAKIIGQTFFSALLPAYSNINIYYRSQFSVSNKYFVRGHHPPIPSVRILMQRFQI